MTNLRAFKFLIGGMLAAAAMVVVLGLFAPSAHAQVVVQCPPSGTLPANNLLVCWQNATQDINGVALPATGPGSLKQTRIQRAIVPAGQTCAWSATTNEAQFFDVTPDVLMVYFENLRGGKWCIRAQHVNQQDVRSDWTGALSKTTPPIIGKPKVPATTIY